MGRHEEPRLTALPSRRARALAFASIVVAGVCGGLIGSSFVELQCRPDCGGGAGLGGLIGALAGAGGVAIVAVLVLRAMGEWARIAEAQDSEGQDDDEGENEGQDDAPKGDDPKDDAEW
ncbi:MAG: hypothetical protein ABIW46_07945 [Acidimicrobiales bacterium]